MNERIKELAEQCWENVPCLPYWVGIAGKRELLSTEKVFNKEKFAELIVKECMGLVDGYTYPVQTQPYTIYHIASETIKQHFGIEA